MFAVDRQKLQGCTYESITKHGDHVTATYISDYGWIETEVSTKHVRESINTLLGVLNMTIDAQMAVEGREREGEEERGKERESEREGERDREGDGERGREITSR